MKIENLTQQQTASSVKLEAINVTKTFFPSIDEYMAQVTRAFNNQWLTNRGELVVELEGKLRDYLDVDNILITNNGTIPLQIALKIFGNGGEIITTPFSYVATTAAIVWESCKPVFVDIHPKYLTIDESKIEEVITEKTTCILATHVFGNPCNIEAIAKIADKHGLKVIYDAAHCFGVQYKGQSIFRLGDISTCSFHATKLFHTGEGGAVFCKDKELMHRIFYHHNFGHNGPLDFFGMGINGKISELQAAMGLAVFPHLPHILDRRRAVVDYYNHNLNFDCFVPLVIREDTDWNYSYYPIIFKDEEILLKVQKRLNNLNIYPRRYFYPSLNKLNYLKEYQKCPVSETVSSRILCLPLSHDLNIDVLADIVRLLNNLN